MNSEREIVKRLFESKELDEASFESGGSVYRCAFGRYYKDNERISRDDYFKAKDGKTDSTSNDSINSKKSYKDYSPEELEDALDDIEFELKEIQNDVRHTDPEDRESEDFEDVVNGFIDELSELSKYGDERHKEDVNKTIKFAKGIMDTEYEPNDFSDDEYNYEDRFED